MMIFCFGVYLLLAILPNEAKEGICHQRKKSFFQNTYLVQKPYKIRQMRFDTYPPFIHPYYKVIMKNETVEEVVVKEHIVEACCPGYQRKGRDCLPVCQSGCQNGRCVKPHQCHCNPGFTGSDCSLPCPQGSFGLHCEKKCKCGPMSICDPINGKCSCADGYHGASCLEKCPDGFWGPNCARLCSCSNGKCDHKNGLCTCKPGFTGSSCDNKCDRNHYGLNCLQKCNCKHGSCNPVDGSCKCWPGYTGQHCSESCPLGTFGKKCMEKCACAPHERCNNMVGCFPVHKNPEHHRLMKLEDKDKPEYSMATMNIMLTICTIILFIVVISYFFLCFNFKAKPAEGCERLNESKGSITKINPTVYSVEAPIYDEIKRKPNTPFPPSFLKNGHDNPNFNSY